MKQLFTILLLLLTLFSFAQTNPNHVYVSGYYKSNGTYVKPHYRTAPNSTNRDNFSTRGNINPYTGQPGYITPDNTTTTYTPSTTYSNSTYSNTNPYTTNNTSSTNSSTTSYKSSSIYSTTKVYGQLWSKPSQFGAIRPLKKGSYVNILEYKDGFYKVISDGTIGYILNTNLNETSDMLSLKNGDTNSTSSISFEEDKATVNEIFKIDISKIKALPNKYVSTQKANLRLGPTTATNILTTIERNKKIGIIDESTYKGWTKIIIEKDDGYYIGFLSSSLISSVMVANSNQSDKPTEVVKKFLTSLGEGEFYKAFSLTNNPSWNKNGGYNWFSSKDAYGGIESLTIYEIRLENAYDNQAVVFADYYASDPLHTSRRWKQVLILEYQYDSWKIIKTKLVD
jgi:hypothetical protein